MAAHSNILAWKISWTEEPGRLQSMKLQRVNMTFCKQQTATIYIHKTLGNQACRDHRTVGSGTNCHSLYVQ